MKKLNLAIIGQGRSGKDIHGKYYLDESNRYYNVKYVVEEDATRREISLARYPGCTVFENYEALFDCPDIDLVVNASYSQMHAPITKDLLLHGFNVLVEKPFGRTWEETRELILIAEQKNLVLGVLSGGESVLHLQTVVASMSPGVNNLSDCTYSTYVPYDASSVCRTRLFENKVNPVLPDR